MERGLDGNVIGRPGRRQITILTREGWEAALREIGRTAPWTTRRANVLVEGLDLAGQVGRRLSIGEALLEITGEATPCRRMDAQVPGLADARWRAAGGPVSRAACYVGDASGAATTSASRRREPRAGGGRRGVRPGCVGERRLATRRHELDHRELHPSPIAQRTKLGLARR
ncbi:MAG: hypothetical protein IPK07_28115 [Deltaproteobacteria bacterium]|nr:hypothetical protein [Deltaproteobacteria bacterium]